MENNSGWLQMENSGRLRTENGSCELQIENYSIRLQREKSSCLPELKNVSGERFSVAVLQIDNSGGFSRRTTVVSFRWKTTVCYRRRTTASNGESWWRPSAVGFKWRTVVGFAQRTRKTAATGYRRRATAVGFKWRTVVCFARRTTVVSFRCRTTLERAVDG